MPGVSSRWRLGLIFLVVGLPALLFVLFPPFDDVRPAAPPDETTPLEPVVTELREGEAPEPPGRIEGRVTRGGKGVPAALTLRLHPRHGGREMREAETDETGAFSFPGVPPGEHEITAIGRDGVRIPRLVRLLAPLTRKYVELALPAGANAVRGRAVHANGRPFLGTVLVRWRNHANRIAVPTQADGRFLLPGLGAGAVTLEFDAGERFHARGPTVRLPMEEEILVVVDEGAREVRGRVLALGSDTPIAGAMVTVRGNVGDHLSVRVRTTTDGEGRFAVPVPVPDGRLGSIEVEAEGFWVYLSDEPAWREGFVIRLDRATRLAVRLVSAADGRPVPDVPVTATYDWIPDTPQSETRISDIEGRAVFSKIPGRIVTLDAKRNGWRMDHTTVPLEDRFLFLEPGHSREVDLPVHRTGLLIVKVTTASGEAADGSYVEWACGSASGGGSGAKGELTLPDLLPGEFTLTARMWGLSGPPFRGVLAPGEVRRVTLPLPPGAWAEVEVRDAETDAPIPRARIEFAPGGMQRMTDARGHARVGPLRPGAQEVTVHAQGYRSAAKPCEFDATAVSRIGFSLERGLVISGRVLRPDGTPAAGGYVRSDGPDARSGYQVVRVAADGSFSLRGLAPGALRISASAPASRGQSYVCRRIVRAGESGVVLTLGPRDTRKRRTLELVVADASGTPVPRADYQVLGLDEEGESVFDHEGQIVDGRSRVSVPETVTGMHLLVSGARRMTGAPLPLGAVHLGPVSASPDTFEVVLPAALEITGRVLDPDGRGMARIQVEASILPWPDGQGPTCYPWSVWSGPDGTFRIGGLGTGTVELVCYPPEEMVQSRPVRVAAGEEDVVIRLESLVEATVTIRDAAGRPVDNVEVEATAEAGLSKDGGGQWESPDAWGHTGPDGRVVLQNLARNGSYRLLVRPDDRESGHGAVRIDGWQPGNLDVTLPPARSVAGRALLPDSTPYDGEDGRIWSWGRARGWGSVDVEEGGAFRAEGFGAGRVALLWIPPDAEPWSEPEVEPGKLPHPVQWVDAGDEKIVFRLPSPR